MDRNTRSIVPPMNHMKRQNGGQISPREMQHNNSGSYSNHQTYHHYSTQNHSNSSSSSSSSYSSSNQKPHPNSDLIDFVHGAWKEKSASEVFKVETSEKHSHFDLDGWMRTRQQHKAT